MQNQKKWYNSKGLLILLFFILPPLGIYGIIKRKTITWKKLLYIIPAGFFTFLLIIAIIGVFFINHYTIGLNYYDNKQYIEAYESFKLVSKDNENYNDAMLKLDSLKPIVLNLKLNADSEKRKIKEIKNKEKKELEEKEYLKNNPQLSYPKIQQGFMKVIEQSYTDYKNAPNELKKSAIRTERGKLIKSILGNTRKFTDWVCVVKSLETTRGGNAIFEVEIENTKISLKTWNNDFQLFNTLIKQSDPLYNIISDLKKGDKIIISGLFMKSNKNDYIFEFSITEKGSMRKPDFIIKFEKIKKY